MPSSPGPRPRRRRPAKKSVQVLRENVPSLLKTRRPATVIGHSTPMMEQVLGIQADRRQKASRLATKRPQTGDMEQNRPKTWDGWQGWGGASRREWAETGMCEGLAQGAVPRERHDGVRSTTVTGLAAGRGRKREALAVKRPVLPPFPPTD